MDKDQKSERDIALPSWIDKLASLLKSIYFFIAVLSVLFKLSLFRDVTTQIAGAVGRFPAATPFRLIAASSIAAVAFTIITNFDLREIANPVQSVIRQQYSLITSNLVSYATCALFCVVILATF